MSIDYTKKGKSGVSTQDLLNDPQVLQFLQQLKSFPDKRVIIEGNLDDYITKKTSYANSVGRENALVDKVTKEQTLDYLNKVFGGNVAKADLNKVFSDPIFNEQSKTILNTPSTDTIIPTAGGYAPKDNPYIRQTTPLSTPIPPPAVTPSNITQTKPFGIENINKTLTFGSQGADVKELQNYLAGMGAVGVDGKPLKADGIYGHDTQAAVMKFQQDHGLTQDGVFGSNSLAMANNVAGTSTQYGSTGGGSTLNNSSNTSSVTPDTGTGNTITYNGQTYTTSSASDAALVRAVLAGIDNVTTNSGMKINPELNLGPDIIAKILEKAKATVHPQYAQQIAGIQQDLQRNAGNTVDAYGRDIAGKEASFQNNLGTARENYADSGLAFSGGRAKGELGMQANENRDLASLSSQYGNTLGDYARNAEISLGTSGYNAGYQLPNVSNYSASLSGNGGFNQNGNVNTQFTPGTYQMGTVPQSEAAAALALRNQNVDEASSRKTAGLSYNDLYS